MSLRIGLVLGSLDAPRWVGRLVAELTGASYADLVMVALLPGSTDGRVPGLRRLWDALDRRCFPPPRSLRGREALAPLLAGHRVIAGQPAVSGLREAELDVLVHLAADPGIDPGIDPTLAALARYGLWTLTPPEGSMEVAEGRPVTAVEIRGLSPRGGPERVLHRAPGATILSSAGRNRASAEARSVRALLRLLSAVALEGEAALEPAASPGPAPSAAPAGVPALARRLALELLHRVRDSRRWRIGIAPGNPIEVARAPHRVRFLEAPPGVAWADPFPVAHGSGHVLLVEEIPAAGSRPRIAAIVLDRAGGRGPADTVLAADHDLAYPFVFSWRGEQWLLPDAWAAGRLDLYRADPFPFRWRHEARLLEGRRLADATLTRCGDTWWMFAGAAAEGAPPWDELELFHAPTPLGPWEPHRANPVKVDPRSARPAGRLFELNGELYRPAQDCTLRYGRAVVIHRVLRLDGDRFEEVEVARLTPWICGMWGTHTLNEGSGLTAIDAR